MEKWTRRSFLKASSASSIFLLTGCASSVLRKDDPFRKIANDIPPNRYLTGNYAAVFDELPATPCSIQGKIPKALNGLFLRNGPNPVYPPTPYHFFDGDGMVHAVRIENGQASYMNHFVETE